MCTPCRVERYGQGKALNRVRLFKYYRKISFILQLIETVLEKMYNVVQACQPSFFLRELSFVNQKNFRNKTNTDYH